MHVILYMALNRLTVGSTLSHNSEEPTMWDPRVRS